MIESRDVVPPSPRSGARQKAVSAAKIALAALLLAWLVRSGRLNFQVFSALDGRALLWLALAALLQTVMIATMAARWRAWLRAFAFSQGARAHLSWREALVVTARGACAGAWTPAGLGLDGIRAAHALRRFSNANPEGKGDAEPAGGLSLSSLLRGEGGSCGIARVVGLASLLDRAVAVAILVALALPFLASRLTQPGRTALALGAAAAGLGLVVWRAKVGKADGAVNWRVAVSASAWTLGTHGANILALGAVLQALAPGLGIERAMLLAFQVGPMITLSNALPLTPLGLGVADATGEALLASHGLDCGGEAVMLTRATWLAVCLLAGVAFWLPERSEEAAR